MKINKGIDKLHFPLKGKYLAMLAPSFIVDFSYPKIICQLKELGFDKVVELTFGAKMINREYHSQLEKSNKMMISSVCPGIVETLKTKYPSYVKNLISADSPMTAMAKICRKTFPKHKIVFISPCNFKKIEAGKCKNIDYILDYRELKCILDAKKLTNKKYSVKNLMFDKFYNDYTKIYPLSGGLSKTARVSEILKAKETKTIDGIDKICRFLSKPNKKIKFLDVTFCKGGCVGGACINSKLPLLLKKRKVITYVNRAKGEKIPAGKKGILKEAEGISFKTSYK